MTKRLLAVVAVALCAAAGAVAEPIRYRVSDLTATPPTGYLADKLHFSFTGPAEFTVAPGLVRPTLWTVDEAPATPPATGISKWFGTDPGPVSAIESAGFAVSFLLTDIASGASATVNLHGQAVVNWFRPTSGSPWQLIENYAMGDTPPYTNDFDLGGNRYSVSTLPSRSLRAGELYVGVEPIPTPEPTTLLLAALGLPAVGLWRRSKRRCVGRVGSG